MLVFLQPLVSDHVVLGSRLKDWTPQERQFGCQAQIHLTRMTSDMILKANAALSKHAKANAALSKHATKSSKQGVRFWQISIKEAFVRRQNKQNMTGSGSKDGACVDEKSDVSENNRNVFTAVRRQTGTGVIAGGDSPVAKNRGSETLASDSVNVVGIVHNDACGPSSTVVRCLGEDAGSESAQQMVSPVNRKRAAEMLEVPVTSVMENDDSLYTACEAKMSRYSTAAIPTQKAGNVPASVIKSGSNGEANDLVPFLTNDCSTDQASRGVKISLLDSGKRSLSYPEFVRKYFQTKSVTIYTKLMYYQSYLRSGLLPKIAVKRIT